MQGPKSALWSVTADCQGLLLRSPRRLGPVCDHRAVRRIWRLCVEVVEGASPSARRRTIVVMPMKIREVIRLLEKCGSSNIPIRPS
jgi:hypothetical protein